MYFLLIVCCFLWPINNNKTNHNDSNNTNHNDSNARFWLVGLCVGWLRAVGCLFLGPVWLEIFGCSILIVAFLVLILVCPMVVVVVLLLIGDGGGGCCRGGWRHRQRWWRWSWWRLVVACCSSPLFNVWFKRWRQIIFCGKHALSLVESDDLS